MTFSTDLRTELNARAQRYAQNHSFRSYQSLGHPPTILFSSDSEHQFHANFLPATYRAILADPQWAVRLTKPHQRKKALPPERRDRACELDSCTSSDALLMNIFCHPDFCPSNSPMFPGTSGLRPEFGAPGNVQLTSGASDITEIDLRIGGILCEAKLCEADFTQAPASRLRTYAAFSELFDDAALPRAKSDYDCYQLLRNVMAAAQHDCSFRLLIDRRRADLLDFWKRISAAIRHPIVKERCAVVFWQELAAFAPPDLRGFLSEKYGIEDV